MLVYLQLFPIAMETTQAKPLYQAVADNILEKIESGNYKPNERIPSEAELGELYGVGRNTIRHALSELVKNGDLVTLHGVGTFVSDGSRHTKTAEYLYGMSQELAERGHTVSSKVLEADIIPADAFLSRRLGVQLGAEVAFLSRLRLLDGEPVAIERAYLPHALCPGILDHDFSAESLYEVLSTEYNRRPHHAEQEIEGELATPQVAKLLKLEQPAVVLVFHRETRLADGKVIEYVDSELRADRFRFYAHLRLNARQSDLVFGRMPVNSGGE